MVSALAPSTSATFTALVTLVNGRNEKTIHLAIAPSDRFVDVIKAVREDPSLDGWGIYEVIF